MNRAPITITTGTARDFTGETYEVEELPAPGDCAEGDTCTIHWPGDSGWYETTYRLTGGAWVEETSTAPWQFGVGW